MTLETRLRLAAHAEAPVSGIVQEYETAIGSVVNPGQIILTIAATQGARRKSGQKNVDRFDAIIFVESGEAKLIRPGMRAHVVPSTVKPEEFGTIVSSVETVAESPSSERNLIQVLQNETLARELSRRSAPYMIRLEMEYTDKTKSHFKWSSGAAPPFPVTAGTLCSASVVVRTQAPITLIVPFFKKLLRIS